jgi:hypothetical protein
MNPAAACFEKKQAADCLLAAVDGAAALLLLHWLIHADTVRPGAPV